MSCSVFGPSSPLNLFCYLGFRTGVNIKITSSRNGIPNEVSFSRPALRGAGDSGQGPMTDLGHSASGLFVLGIAERVLDGGWLSEPFPRFWRQTVRRHNCFQQDPLGVFHVVLPTLPPHIRRPLPHRHLDPVESRPIGKQVGFLLLGVLPAILVSSHMMLRNWLWRTSRPPLQAHARAWSQNASKISPHHGHHSVFP
jgi:hypothetical protein